MNAYPVPGRPGMRPLIEFGSDARRAIRGVFADIDDTLTTDGRLTGEAYAAMEHLQRAGLLMVPITGRPAGWCDHIARMWPVDGVVGENGAFYFRYDPVERVMHRRFVDDAETRATRSARLIDVGVAIVKAVPGSAIAADQRYRETDLAIDYCEDVPRLPDAAVERIVALTGQHGLTAKVRSIHVNGWFGRYDKLTMTKQLMQECFGVDLDAGRAAYVFVGDSPNDCPMFAHFPHAVGVANLRDFEGRLAHAPAYLASGRGGAGFREVADCILAARARSAHPGGETP